MRQGFGFFPLLHLNADWLFQLGLAGACMLLAGRIWRPILGLRTMAIASTNYTPGTHSVVYVTVPNEDTGRAIAKGLVEGKLAACVNMIAGVKSIYEWEGKIEEDTEHLLIIKTRSSRLADLAQFVKTHHPYDVPEVISLKIEDGHQPYLDWIGKIVAP